MSERNPAKWPSLLLALFRPREYDRRLVVAEEASREWLEAQMRELNLRRAREQVARLRKELSPERRLQLQQSLAQWEAHLDSMEDDGVFSLVKGDF